jgi:MarC family membrane protein
MYGRPDSTSWLRSGDSATAPGDSGILEKYAKRQARDTPADQPEIAGRLNGSLEVVEYVEEYLVFLVSLFAIVNPFAVIPVFMSLTRGQRPDGRRRVPRRTAIAVFVTLTVAYFIGEGLLRLFSASIMSLRIAGGLIVFRSAWVMLGAHDVEAKRTEVKAAQGGPGIAIVPLAIPLTAGPGAISLMIVAGSTRGYLPDAAAISSVLLVSISIYFLFRSADRIARVLGETGMSVMERLMGLILAVIAVELITTGLGEVFPGLLK